MLLRHLRANSMPSHAISASPTGMTHRMRDRLSRSRSAPLVCSHAVRGGLDAACRMHGTGPMTPRIELAALISWADDSESVVSLDQLGSMPPGKLAGASIRLVKRCPCCGSWRSLEPADTARAAE